MRRGREAYSVHTYVHLLVSKSVVEERSDSLDERTDVADVRTAAAFGGARILASAAAAAAASSVTHRGRSGHSSCSSEWQSAQLRCEPGVVLPSTSCAWSVCSASRTKHRRLWGVAFMKANSRPAMCVPAWPHPSLIHPCRVSFRLHHAGRPIAGKRTNMCWVGLRSSFNNQGYKRERLYSLAFA